MFIKYISKCKLLIALYITLVIIVPIVGIQSTYSVYDMFDVAKEGNTHGILVLLIKIFVIYIVHGLLLHWTEITRAGIVRKVRTNLREDMFESIICASNAFFAKQDVGIHIASFSNDISILEYKYFEAGLTLLQYIISIITVSVAIVSLNSVLAVVVLCGELASVLICIIAKKRSEKKYNEFIEQLSNFTQKIKDYFAAFATIKNYSAENVIENRFEKINEDTENKKTEADFTVNFIDWLGKICNTFVKFTVVGLGMAFVLVGTFNFGTVYVAYQFTDQLIVPMHGLIRSINSVNSVKGVIKHISEIFVACKEETNHKNKLSGNKNSIVLQRVSVDKKNKKILSDVSFEFEPKKKYLIIGKNGSGKSTLLRLLKRSDEDYSGLITIGDYDIRELSSREIGTRVSYINEQVSLFCDTVKNNITLFRDCDETVLQEVINKVGLKVPLDRSIRDGELNVSSGESRRIELARALLNSADTIILDEATSTLDIVTAYEIEKTVLTMQDKTVIFVSHNFSGFLIDQYDAIILLDDGRIIDHGTHTELKARNAKYKNLLRIKNGQLN